MNAELKALGEKLAAHRLARGLRPEALAAQAGLPRLALQRLEAGRGGSLEDLLKILNALGLEERFSALLPDPDETSEKPVRRSKLMSAPATHSASYGKSGEWKPDR